MKLNRRNALLTLATVAAGSGTAIATGAFSSLSADRTTTINTASDEEAVLALIVDDGYSGLSDGDGDIIELNFSQLNQSAKTTFDDVLTIENNGSETVKVDFEYEPAGILNFDPGAPEIAANDSVAITITVDLKNNSADNVPDEITISAET